MCQSVWNAIFATYVWNQKTWGKGFVSRYHLWFEFVGNLLSLAFPTYPVFFLVVLLPISSDRSYSAVSPVLADHVLWPKLRWELSRGNVFIVDAASSEIEFADRNQKVLCFETARTQRFLGCGGARLVFVINCGTCLYGLKVKRSRKSNKCTISTISQSEWYQDRKSSSKPNACLLL